MIVIASNVLPGCVFLVCIIYSVLHPPPPACCLLVCVLFVVCLCHNITTGWQEIFTVIFQSKWGGSHVFGVHSLL